MKNAEVTYNLYKWLQLQQKVICIRPLGLLNSYKVTFIDQSPSLNEFSPSTEEIISNKMDNKLMLSNEYNKKNDIIYENRKDMETIHNESILEIIQLHNNVQELAKSLAETFPKFRIVQINCEAQNEVEQIAKYNTRTFGTPSHPCLRVMNLHNSKLRLGQHHRASCLTKSSGKGRSDGFLSPSLLKMETVPRKGRKKYNSNYIYGSCRSALKKIAMQFFSPRLFSPINNWSYEY